ncbi:TPA: SDR family oxidoreductase [Pseudomonas aeruginosa]|uniref:SDR family oxidoreductase n=2 Tax=Pseudomonas aeruginosa group TaxID=136841 RepID=A0ABD7JTQ2_PSEAI|nr:MULTISPECIES: SDR family NAD(P)-dependent oxidoreductase [Pseudomonas aeruginosa group]ABR82540.1 bacilysin biosynthesis oxidoreductase BacC [Pseudomonas aeruginosa PA7]KSC37402.1 3-oxoacyl-ACP reductase [Pseudomonas paraeruginosa]KSC93235.1 3-oxoacyl-ACP reductase [Pseudomonas aeruginosa]KSD27946.1 3-oxoacyl-ACP reductase [Pseudomonas aeruginosa]KSG43081.1 3-oxoacyl-ACP reductase [Pseudomonas aeruginosa]
MSKTVIVTGASSGLGFAIAEACLGRGYNVVGNARSMQRLEQAAARFTGGGRFLPVAGDIARADTARRLFAIAIEAFGKVDILVNNAGIFIPKPVAEYTEEDLEALVGTNLKGFFYPAQEAARHMPGNGGGQIVNITASIALQPNLKVPALLPVLVKGGLNQATRALALELAADNVRVNAVAPGIIDTPLHGEGSREALRGLAPSRRVGRPQDVVDAVLYLADSRFTTGTVLAVDGGSASGVW